MKGNGKSLKEREVSLIAKEIAKSLRKLPAKKRAPLILLSGNLGSGKTTFTKYFARSLGVEKKVHSPTFVFVHEYHLKKEGRFSKLIHVDAYRMVSRRDVLQTGIRDYLSGPTNIVLIEWGERIKKWIPRPDISITFEHENPTHRRVNIKSFIHAQKRKK